MRSDRTSMPPRLQSRYLSSEWKHVCVHARMRERESVNQYIKLHMTWAVLKAKGSELHNSHQQDRQHSKKREVRMTHWRGVKEDCWFASYHQRHNRNEKVKGVFEGIRGIFLIWHLANLCTIANKLDIRPNPFKGAGFTGVNTPRNSV